MGASFWQNPANHALTRGARASHDRSNSLPRLRQAFKTSPTLLANPEIVDRIVQAGLWFAGETAVDAMLFEILKGSSDAQRRSFARVLRAHPGFTQDAPITMNTPEYRRTLCDHARSVLTAQPSWRTDEGVMSGIDAVRKRFSKDTSIQALAGWMISMQSDEATDGIPGNRAARRPTLVT